MKVHENDKGEDPENIKQSIPSYSNKQLQRPSSGDHKMQIGVFKANMMLSDPIASQHSKSQEMTWQRDRERERRPISSKITNGNKTMLRYAKTPLDGIDEGLALQTLNKIDSNMA
jgi:hypothetical protein